MAQVKYALRDKEFDLYLGSVFTTESGKEGYRLVEGPKYGTTQFDSRDQAEAFRMLLEKPHEWEVVPCT